MFAEAAVLSYSWRSADNLESISLLVFAGYTLYEFNGTILYEPGEVIDDPIVFDPVIA